ncbi:hypothetical protein D3C77_548410 [compost metagenome]
MAVGDLVIDHETVLATGFITFGTFVFLGFVLLAFDFFFVIDTVLVRVGLVGQQVLQVHGKTVTGRHPQHDRPRPLVRAQGDLARHRGAAVVQRHLVHVDYIAAQGEHHAVGILRTEAVEHQWLIERHHVGHQIALAAHGGFADGVPAKGGGGDQQ